MVKNLQLSCADDKERISRDKNYSDDTNIISQDKDYLTTMAWQAMTKVILPTLAS